MKILCILLMIFVLGCGTHSFGQEVLMLHFDNNFLDSSESKHIASPFGNVRIDNSRSAMGGGSAYFDGDLDYIVVTDSDDLHLSGDFIIDFYVMYDGHMPVNVGPQWAPPLGGAMLFGQFEYSGHMLEFYLEELPPDKVRPWKLTNLYHYKLYTSRFNKSRIAVISEDKPYQRDTWYHIAFEKRGTTYKLFVNDEEVAVNISGRINERGSGKQELDKFVWENYDGDFWIGSIFGERFNLYFKGWIDEFRIIKGKR